MYNVRCPSSVLLSLEEGRGVEGWGFPDPGPGCPDDAQGPHKVSLHTRESLLFH
jgi:hypothetical protein